MEVFVDFQTAAKGTAHLISLGLIISLTRQRGGFFVASEQIAVNYKHHFRCFKRMVACVATDIAGSVIERQL